jgi:DNA-binding NtrC family response regulator
MDVRTRILIVDDEKDICDLLFRLLKKEGYMPIVAHSGETALEMISLGMPDLVISDLRMPGMDGMELLRQTKKMDPNLPVLMITGWGGIDGAVRAVKEGAYDYMAKPLNIPEFTQKVKEALAEKQPGVGKPDAKDKLQNEAIVRLHEMMGPSDAVTRITSELSLVAPSNFSVIVLGETGTGKELLARAIHQASQRAKAQLIPVDCGAIPETLFESELFGYEKGAFTGAATSKPGKFELADGGTLFLDEIGNMPLSSQIKLLRAIQEKSFFRVGGRKAVTVDVRLIVATNEDLNAAIRDGSFSRDLFYRLSEFTILIPPLRNRKEDMLHIANRLLQATNVELGKDVKGFSPEAIRSLTEYSWPGNVRQLRSAVRRAVLQADSWIDTAHLSIDENLETEIHGEPRNSDFKWAEGLSLKEMVRRSTAELERRVLQEALRKTGGNKAKAARLLQMDYTTIHAKIKQYGINLESDEDA